MTGWLFETMIASSVLMALVLAVRAPVRQAFGPQVAYLLWALPALRWLLPPLPVPSLWSWAATLYPAAEPVAALAQPAIDAMSAEPASVAAAAQPAVDVAALALASLPWVWAAVALAFLGLHVARYLRFREAVLQGAAVLDVRGGVLIAISRQASAPMAFGIRTPVVVLPAAAAHQDDPCQRLAIEHELTHHRRGDLWVNGAALIILALNWFNPLAYVSYRAFRVDQELACDADVLSVAGPHALPDYGRAIVRAAAGRVSIGVCHLNPVDHLKRRLRMLNQTPHSRTRQRVGLGIIVGTLIGGLSLSATSMRAATESEAAPPQAPPAPGAISAAPVLGEHVTTVRHDGRTIVLRTNTKLSQAEIDALVAEAEASRGEAERATVDAEQAMAETEQAMAEADMAREGAEAQRRIAMLNRRSDERMAAPPAPPVPPAPPTPPGGSAVTALPAPPALTCDKNGDRVQTSQIEVMEGGKRSVSRQVVVCDKAMQKVMNEAMQKADMARKIAASAEARSRAAASLALREARDDIAAASDMTSELRTRALISLDRQLERME